MDEGIYMSKRGQLSYETVTDFLHGKLSRGEAAELLQVRERTISRLARRIEAKGFMGVIHGNRERVPENKIAVEVKREVMVLVKKHYFDFNMTHALEKLRENHAIEVTYHTYRRWCHEEKLVKRCKRRKTVARSRRARMPFEGLLLQMDGSPHRYNGVDEWCLIAAIDDATSDIPYAEFFHSEDTLSCMTVLQRIIEKKGIPHAIYTDGAGCLGGAKRAHFGQFKRACEELGIRVIIASSPEAKGRIERAWDTFQDRIIPEMRLRNIRSMPAANSFLQEQFLPNYWKKKNTVIAKSPEIRYRPLSPTTDLREIFCLKVDRMVKRDHTLSWEGVRYRLDSPVRYSIYKQQIEFRTYQDLTWQAFYAGKPIPLIALAEPLKAVA
jgi:transposase-like protein